MKAKLDPVDGKWFIVGHESHRFTSEEDAETAHDYAIDFVCYEMNRETRHRRSAERAPETVGQYVENQLLAAAKSGHGLSAERCRELAYKLGVLTNV